MTTLSTHVDLTMDHVPTVGQIQRLHLPDVPHYARNFSERYATFKALNHARKNAYHIADFDLNRAQFVIFSDVHKGDGNPLTDDFQHNSTTYQKALYYYLHQGYKLILNGDIEECWKTPYSAILDVYGDSAFAIERDFVRKGGEYYLRTYGNHDDDWANPNNVKRHLAPALKQQITVYPAIQLGDKIMIAHGHQGDWASDRIARLSRSVVRRLWRPIQETFHVQLEEPIAQNHPICTNRDRYLHQWAATHHQMLIAGHTHRPHFHPRSDQPIQLGHYVNLGSCVHTDGLSGIEIDRGEMRLIRWTNESSSVESHRVVIDHDDLGTLLAKL